MTDTFELPPHRPRRRRSRLLWLILLAVLLFGGATTVSYYVEALWFSSLGYGDVFWKTLNLQATIFSVFAGITFLSLYGAFLLLKPVKFSDLGWDGVILVSGRPVQLPVEPAIRAAALLVAIAAAFIAGVSFMSEWPTLALWWYGAAGPAPAAPSDPIFG